MLYCKHLYEALVDGSHIAYLVLDGESFTGAGGVSFFQVMPGIEKGIVYHWDGINGDYDALDDAEKLMKFIMAGKR